MVKERLNISFVKCNQVKYLIKENYNNMKDLKQIITNMIKREIVENEEAVLDDKNSKK